MPVGFFQRFNPNLRAIGENGLWWQLDHALFDGSGVTHIQENHLPLVSTQVFILDLKTTEHKLNTGVFNHG